MSAKTQIRKQADAAIYWLECVELAQAQGDATAAEYARERAQFASNHAFRIAQVSA